MSKQKGLPRCYTTHKPMPLGDFQVFGGSCLQPVVKHADIYIGLDSSMQEYEDVYPWNNEYDILFEIPNYGVPKDKKEFTRMIHWLAERIEEGLIVHVGCIGGHGRTGMVLAALVKCFLNETDAISYVREHYCKKAVETDTQVAWLHNHFGIKPVAPRHSAQDMLALSKKTRRRFKKKLGAGVTYLDDWSHNW